MGNGLAPMVEVALAQVKQRGNQFELTTQQIVLLDIELQVDSQCEESGLVISGFYHAHDNLRDNHVDVFSQKIADKVFFTQSHAGSIPLFKSLVLSKRFHTVNFGSEMVHISKTCLWKKYILLCE